MGKRRFASLIARGLRAIDVYGHPINLTYKGETSYKSILTRLLILAILVQQFTKVIYKDSTLINSSIIRNATLDPTEYKFDLKSYDLAVRITYIGD